MPGSADKSYRDRLYDAYVSTHAGTAINSGLAEMYSRDIRPHLPSDRTAPIVDLGCGQGALVRLLGLDGFPNARGIDISQEQVAAAHAAGTASVELGDFFELLERRESTYGAVLALDLLEHLSKRELLATFDIVRSALRPGGSFIARVPNADSPFGGHYRFGDVTHETSFNQRSLQQLARASGFVSFEARACPPIAHGLKSLVRAAIWKGFSGAYKLSLAAETGNIRGQVVTLNCLMVARTPQTMPADP